MLGLFPTIDPAALGGVQEAGRLAWRAIQKSQGADHCKLICYSPGNRTVGDESGNTVIGHSKAGVVLAALRGRWPFRTILVWHLGLLRLVPFLRPGLAQVVVFLHGVEAWRRHDWLTHRMLERADLFLTNSNYTWDRFVATHPRYERHLHRTVHLGLGTPLGPAGVAGSELKPVAAMIGRMDRAEDYKGHREMIGAWPLVTRRIPDAELWVLGGGDLLPELKDVATQAGVEQRVRFLGRVTEEQKEEVLAQCRCLALPSRGEGFGLVYLEAMRYGKPCVVSTVDAGREVVNPPEAGLAVDPDSPQEIAEATSRLLAGGAEWAGFSKSARRRYEARFTAADFQQRLLEALCL